MLGNDFDVTWIYAKNTTARMSIQLRGKSILTTTVLHHVYGFFGLTGAGAHAFVAEIVPTSGFPDNFGDTKPSFASNPSVNYVTYGLTAIRAEGAALISIYYQN